MSALAAASDEHCALDLHHLTASYKVPKGDKQAFAAQARDATQALVAGLFALPAERTAAGPVARLPLATTPLPREKPVPEPRPETKWEAFAKAKGIDKKKKKARLEWDEDRRKWAPAWGYDKAGGDEADAPIIEVAGPDAPDPREEARAAKKARVDKNKQQRDANDARAKKRKKGQPEAPADAIPFDVDDARAKRGGKAVGAALKRAQTATASLGNFDATVDGEGARPKAGDRAKGRKRRFLEAVHGGDRERGLKVLEDLARPRASRPKKGTDEVMDTHDGELPNRDGFKHKKGMAAKGKSKKITKKRGK